MADNVNHPAHYNTGEIEVINYIKDKLNYEEFTGYLTGNIIPYPGTGAGYPARRDPEIHRRSARR